MKKIIIFGLSDLGRLLLWYLKKDTIREVVAFTANEEFIDSDFFCDLPVVSFEKILDNYSPKKYEILIAIGNRKMNDIRKDVFDSCKLKGYSIASYIHSSVSLNSNDLGEGNIILENSLIYPFSKIGDGNLLWDHVLISHDCVVGNFNTFSSYADLCGYVAIGNNGYYGKHCIINDYAKMADYTLVGAAAYAKKDSHTYDVIVPARSITLENKKSTDLM
jgi:sugar O-acyltransferase (sialic acid O-acetyltransferase NeuD family)